MALWSSVSGGSVDATVFICLPSCVRVGTMMTD